MKLKPIPTYTVVHTPTEEEAKELLAILHENGYKWNMGDSLIDHTNWCGSNCTYHIYPDENVVTYDYRVRYESITLPVFKERYIPKYEEGDKVKVCGEILTITHIARTEQGGFLCRTEDGRTWKYEDLEPYTEPETNLPKSVGLKTERKPTEDMETKEEKSENPINLCELLKSHEGEEFFSLAYGEVVLEEIRRGTQRGDSPDFLCVRATSFDSGTIIVNPNGKLRNAGVVDLVPSRALYEQYPLDPYTAWMKWQEEQKKYDMHIQINTTESDCFGESELCNTLHFRTSADRDKCIEEIKAIIEKYSKK